VFENRVLRRIFGPETYEVTEVGGNFVKRSFIICTLHQIILRCKIKESEMGGACGTNGRDEKCTHIFLSEKPERMRSLGRPKHRWGII
jgi:hypothetical protein